MKFPDEEQFGKAADAAVRTFSLKNNGWNAVLASILRIKGARVNRTEFLRQVFEQLPAGRTWMSAETVQELAAKRIRRHTIETSAASAAAGLPGGFALLATVPADVMQYLWHTVVLAQELCYLYGTADLFSEDGRLSDQGNGILTLAVCLMLGSRDTETENAFSALYRALKERALKNPSFLAVTARFWYHAAEKAAEWLGAKLAGTAARGGLSKFLPLIGAAVNGIASYATFSSAAVFLESSLRNAAKAAAEEQAHGGFSA